MDPNCLSANSNLQDKSRHVYFYLAIIIRRCKLIQEIFFVIIIIENNKMKISFGTSPNSNKKAGNTEPGQDTLNLDFDSFIIGLLTRLSARVSHISSKVYLEQCDVGISEARVLGVLNTESNIQAVRICKFTGNG